MFSGTLAMDLTYLPHLTDDELTYEITCRGLPDGGSAVEKRNVLEAILTSSLAVKYPVQPPNPKDDQTEYVWCVAKLSELSSRIVSLGSPVPDSVDFLHARLKYVRLRIDRISNSDRKTILMVIWSKALEDCKSQLSVPVTRDLLTFAEPVVQTDDPPDRSFYDKLNCLNWSTVSATNPAVTNPVTTTVAPVVAPSLATASWPKPSVSFIPPMHSSFSIPPATPPPLPHVSSPSYSPPTFNKYVQVSRWKLTYNGVGSINAFLERVEEKAVSYGVREEQLFQQAGELFTDHALVWFRSVRNDVKTWVELVDRLRTAFLPADYEYELWDEIRARTQGPEERVEIFVAVMQNLLNRFVQPVPEQVRLQVIIRNLQPSFQSEMSVRQCTSIPTLLAVCRNIEDAAHRVAAFKNPPTRAIRLLEPELAFHRERSVVHEVETSSKPPRLCWNCRSPEHFSAACPQPHRRRCYSCGKAGVIKSSCPTCQAKSKNEEIGAGKSTPGPTPSR